MSGTSSTMMLLRMGFSLAIILGMIWLAARVLRRRGKLTGATCTDLELVSRRSMGRRSNLVVVRVGGRTLLVGSTDTQVSLVADLTDTDLTATDSADEDTTATIDLVRPVFPTVATPTVLTPTVLTPTVLLEAIRSRTVRRA